MAGQSMNFSKKYMQMKSEKKQIKRENKVYKSEVKFEV